MYFPCCLGAGREFLSSPRSKESSDLSPAVHLSGPEFRADPYVGRVGIPADWRVLEMPKT